MKTPAIRWMLALFAAGLFFTSFGPGCSRSISPEEKASLYISDDAFNARVYNDSHPVLLNFTASWCPPCQAMAPTLDDIAQNRSGLISVMKIDVDVNPHLAQRFKISGVPTYYIYRDGEALAALSGARTKDDFIAWIENTLIGKDS
ncbi:MAG TPA: thioredoxin [Kiritimatiellia bacterium]|nr:thioredoxin [Kiritimatiellia bacterium]